MSRITPHITALIVFILYASFGFSQPNVSVRAGINRNKILIGEPVELKLEARVPAGTAAGWFALDSMKHFELVNKGKIDTIVKADESTYRQTVTITSFDSGRWALPSLALTIGNREYLTDSLPISVAYSNFDPKQNYHDIKDIVEVENTAVRFINWILLALSLVSLLAVIFFLRSHTAARAPASIGKAPTALSPLEEALQALGNLRKRGYAEPVHTKTFHTELNDIFRQFIFRKAGIATMEKTSSELIMQLKQFSLPAHDFTTLVQALRMNDAVKFAKFQPGVEENGEALQTIVKSVEQLDKTIV